MKTEVALIIFNDMDSGSLDKFLVPMSHFGDILPGLEDMDNLDNSYWGENFSSDDLEEVATSFYTEDVDNWQINSLKGTLVPEEYKIVRVFNLGFVG